MSERERDLDGPSMDFLPLLLLLLLLLFLGAGSSEAGDLELLISFKRSLSNPQVLKNWDPSQSTCSFAGVSCKAGRVVGVAIQSLVLNADYHSVSSYLLTLGSLESLSLHSVNLTENISTVASRCNRQLAVLDLAGIGLRGTVADVFNLATACLGLRSLNLSGNSVRNPPAGKNPFENPSGSSLYMSLSEMVFQQSPSSGNHGVGRVL